MSINIGLNDMNTLLKALELSMNRKTFSKEEASQFFPIWNNLTTEFDKLRRQNAFEAMYPVKTVVEEPSAAPSSN